MCWGDDEVVLVLHSVCLSIRWKYGKSLLPIHWLFGMLGADNLSPGFLWKECRLSSLSFSFIFPFTGFLTLFSLPFTSLEYNFFLSFFLTYLFFYYFCEFSSSLKS